MWLYLNVPVHVESKMLGCAPALLKARASMAAVVEAFLGNKNRNARPIVPMGFVPHVCYRELNSPYPAVPSGANSQSWPTTHIGCNTLRNIGKLQVPTILYE